MNTAISQKHRLLDIDRSHCPLELYIGLVVVQANHLGGLRSKYHMGFLYQSSLKWSELNHRILSGLPIKAYTCTVFRLIFVMCFLSFCLTSPAKGFASFCEFVKTQIKFTLQLLSRFTLKNQI